MSWQVLVHPTCQRSLSSPLRLSATEPKCPVLVQRCGSSRFPAEPTCSRSLTLGYESPTRAHRPVGFAPSTPARHAHRTVRETLARVPRRENSGSLSSRSESRARPALALDRPPRLPTFEPS